MFINNTKENWEIFKDAVHFVDQKNRERNDKRVVNRVEDVTNDFVREVKRVSKASREGNYTPAIIGHIMARDIAKLAIDTVISIISKRPITNSDIADLAAVIANDYAIPAANLAYQKIESQLIESQLADITA
jgi:hypothetical protein